MGKKWKSWGKSSLYWAGWFGDPVWLERGNNLVQLMDKKTITIYTDGACSGNPGPGGWAAIIIDEGREEELFGAEESTTNQRMELLAAIKALERLPARSRVKLFSDSAYLINAFQKCWFKGWEKGWLNAAGKPVKNKDLWVRLQMLDNFHRITWCKLAGHSGDYYNERCDRLARGAIKKQ